MTDLSTKAARLREMHAFFQSEFERNAHDNAVRLLRSIRQYAEASPAVAPDPLAPSADRERRLLYWLTMYVRARRDGLMARATELLADICAEPAA